MGLLPHASASVVGNRSPAHPVELLEREEYWRLPVPKFNDGRLRKADERM